MADKAGKQGARAAGAAKPPRQKGAKSKVKTKPNRSAKNRRTGGDDDAVEVSVARHPRAVAHVRRAKGWGGLAGFGLAAFLSAQAGVPPEMIGERAVGAGIVGYLLAWGCSVTVWRHLVIAELRTAAELAHAQHQAAAEAAEAAAAPTRF